MNKKLTLFVLTFLAIQRLNSATPPAALVTADDTLSPVSGSTISATYASINHVAINSSGAGIIGGSYSSPPQAYAARMAPDGTLTQLTGFPISNAVVSGVAINDSGICLITVYRYGGAHPYAALVSADGTVTQLSGGGFLSSSGILECAAINSSGTGLIGGADSSAYVGLVHPDGTVTQLSGGGIPLPGGAITTAAINIHGNGIIGGHARNPRTPTAYAALVASDGTLTQLSGGSFPSSNGMIYSVAINNNGIGLIGGQATPSSGPAYAARVAADGTLTNLSSAQFPSTIGYIQSVAINDSGLGLIGGQDVTGKHPAYAAYVNPDGSLTELSGFGFPSTSGSIQCVAINSSGIGLIGGTDATGIQPYYLSLVAPDGTLTHLKGGHISPTATVVSVAINDAGVGLVGWDGPLYSSSPAFSLVAPNGTMTHLQHNELSSIQDVVPKSMGSTLNAINTQLAATFALSQHLSAFNRQPLQKTFNQSVSLLVGDFPENTSFNQTCEEEGKLSLWAAPFGNYVHQKADQHNPSVTNEIAGVLAAFDYANANFLMGGALGYAYNYIHFGNKIGHGHIQEEMACLYMSYDKNHFRFNTALWGGLYQLDHTRHTLSSITSESHTHGWIFSPHAEMGVPFRFADDNSCLMEPFAMFDWVNNWQSQFTEKGKSGFNLMMNSQYVSLLRSEIGIRFYENIDVSQGSFLLEQKVSYVNQAPFLDDSVSTSFVASTSFFPVAIGSTQIQNLGGAQLRAIFLPSNISYPYFSLDFQGEFGPYFQSYFLGLEIGKKF